MKESFEETFEVWWDKLKNLRNKFCRETYLAGYDQDDLEQECYFIFRQTWEHYDESYGVTFGSYYKVRLHGWRANMNRKVNQRQNVLLEDETGYEDESINIENQIIGKILCEKGLGLLNEGEYELINAYYIKEESLKSIAQRLGLNYKTAENRKKKALEKLRECL